MCKPVNSPPSEHWDADERFQMFMEAAPDAIVIVDGAGQMLLVNQLTEEMFRYHREELLSQPVEMLVPERLRGVHTRHRQGYGHMPRTRPMGAGQTLSGRRKDGSEFPVEISLSPLKTGRGRLVMSIIRDVTERKQTEGAIQQLNSELRLRAAQLEEANRELEAFSYSVSHDLRAPLRAISGYVRMLKEDHAGRLDGEGNRLLDVVQGESERMGLLIDDLLAFSRLGRQHMQTKAIDMSALARSVFESLTHGSPVSNLEFEVEPLPTACGDPAMLRQVFANLIGNALKFTRNKPARLITISGCSSDGVPAYCVRDNGVGFDEKYAHKLFGVFQRLHSDEEFEGTGVGLALVQRVILRHGGKVWAEGKPGQGAAFYFTLSRSLHGS